MPSSSMAPIPVLLKKPPDAIKNMSDDLPIKNDDKINDKLKVNNQTYQTYLFIYFQAMNKTLKLLTNHNYSERSSHFELPSINKTLPVTERSKSNTSLQHSYTKITLDTLAKDIEYETKTEQQIKIEYQELRQLLRQLNLQIGKALEKKSFSSRISRSKSRQKDSAEVLMIRDRQYQNNKKIAEFYKIQYEKLKLREQTVSSHQNINDELKEIQQTIQNTKNEIKQIKKSNTQRGNNLQNGDLLARDMRKMYIDKTFAEEKRDKLSQQLKKIEEQNIIINKKIFDIQDSYAQADKMMLFLDEGKEKENQVKKLEQIFNERKLYLQNFKKRNKQFNEQKYLRKLRELEITTNNIKKHEQRVQYCEKQSQEQRKIVKQLEEKVSLKKINIKSIIYCDEDKFQKKLNTFSPQASKYLDQEFNSIDNKQSIQNQSIISILEREDEELKRKLQVQI